MPRTAFAPRLILPDGRFRLILDRVDPIAEYAAVVVPSTPPAQPLALAFGKAALAYWAPTDWYRSAQGLVAAQRQQVLAFSIGFSASIAVVLTALAAQPTMKRAEAPAPALPVIAAMAENRTATFAAPSLTALVRVAKITVVSDEQPAPVPTPAFTHVVAPVVAALALQPAIARTAPVEAPRVYHAVTKPDAPIAQPHVAPAKAKAHHPAPSAKIVKVEAKPVEVRSVERPSPKMAQAMATRLPPMPSATKSATPPWGNDWMRSTLGMGPNGP